MGISYLSGGDPDSKCKDDNSENSDVICNGRGECKCGICSCKEGSYGQFCECTDDSCPVNPSNDELCSGIEHGVCKCGQCKCNKDWSGDDCGCETATDKCESIFNEEICSGHGKCLCNKCQCD